MNLNMSSPMTQPGFGGFGQQGLSYSIPMSQGMGSQGHGGSGCAQGQNANQGYDAPTITQGQAVPSPSMGQQFGDRPQS